MSSRTARGTALAACSRSPSQGMPGSCSRSRVPTPTTHLQPRLRNAEGDARTREPVTQRVTIPPTATVRGRRAISEFHTEPGSPHQLLDRLDTGDLALLDFQRSFVWAPEATRELLVSIMRRSPPAHCSFSRAAGRFQGASRRGRPATARSPVTARPGWTAATDLALPGHLWVRPIEVLSRHRGAVAGADS